MYQLYWILSNILQILSSFEMVTFSELLRPVKHDLVDELKGRGLTQQKNVKFSDPDINDMWLLKKRSLHWPE